MARQGVMLCYPFEEKRLKRWEAPWIIQPKLDGDRCRALIGRDGKVTLLSSEANRIESVPHIQSAIEALQLAKGIELDGELYHHGMEHGDIRSIVGRTKNIHLEYEDMEFHVFDILKKGYEWYPQHSRTFDLDQLEREIPEDYPIKVVQSHLVHSLQGVLMHLEMYTESGYEGFVLRDHNGLYERKRSTGMMKFKPRKSDTYEIVGYMEETSIEGVPKGTLGSLECMGQTGEERFSVGTGFTADQRRELWRDRDLLIGAYCTVLYQHLTPKRGVPLFPVFSEIHGDCSKYEQT